eukprot:jgi/Ulvmu1/11578/UM079_0021.1
MQDDCVIPLKQNASEQQSAAAKDAAVREFARKYAEQNGVRPTRLSTGWVQSNVATECSIKLRKVGYKRDEIHVNLKPLATRSANRLGRPNPKLEALNKFNRAILCQRPHEPCSPSSTASGAACTMKLLLPPSHALGDPDVSFTTADLSNTIMCARQEQDLVTTRYADVDSCAGLLRVEDTNANGGNVQDTFSVKGRHKCGMPAEQLAEANACNRLTDGIASGASRCSTLLPKSNRAKQASAPFAVTMEAARTWPHSEQIPAVVVRHRESVRRLSQGLRSNQLLVGKMLRPAQTDDEINRVISAKSATHKGASNNDMPCVDTNSLR